MQEDYPLDQFLNHFNAMKYVLKYKTFLVNCNDINDSIEVGDDHSIESNMGRILDYFSQLGYSEEEKRYKVCRLMMILDYLNENIDFFDREQCVILGTKEGPSLVKTSLLKALHEHFSPPGLPKDVTPQQIIDSAKEIDKLEDFL